MSMLAGWHNRQIEHMVAASSTPRPTLRNSSCKSMSHFSIQPAHLFVCDKLLCLSCGNSTSFISPERKEHPLSDRIPLGTPLWLTTSSTKSFTIMAHNWSGVALPCFIPGNCRICTPTRSNTPATSIGVSGGFTLPPCSWEPQMHALVHYIMHFHISFHQ